MSMPYSSDLILPNLEQGTDAWFEARRGVVTGSNFGKIITPKGGSSSQSKDYMCKLVAEYVTKEVEPSFKSEYMKDGNDNEGFAISNYNFINDVVTEHVGLVYMDEERNVSVSPDGLRVVNGSIVGGVEAKCPKPATVVKYIVDNALPDVYKAQVQGSMWVCRCDWWDFIAYTKLLKPMLIRVHRDDIYISKMKELVLCFVEEMIEMRKEVVQ